MERVAAAMTRWTGSTPASVGAFALIAAWLISGPAFHFSDTWQLVINTATTIITFLMVFVIQRSQNKDAQAVALKLNELIAALEGASNRLIDAEHFSEKDLKTIQRHFGTLVKMASHDASLTQSHSVEEAEHRHEAKAPQRRAR